MYSNALADAKNYSNQAVVTPSTVPILSSFSATTEHFSLQYDAILAYLAPLLSIQAFIFLFDYIYRMIQTMKLVSTYWSGSNVKLPPVDMRSGHADYSSIPQEMGVGVGGEDHGNEKTHKQSWWDSCMGRLSKGCKSCKSVCCDSRISLNMLVMASYAWMYTGILIVLAIFVGYTVVGKYKVQKVHIVVVLIHSRIIFIYN